MFLRGMAERFLFFGSLVFLILAGRIGGYVSARSSEQPAGVTPGGAIALRDSTQLISAKDMFVTPIPATYFGMTLENVNNWPTVPFGALGHSPGTGVYWPYVERRKGHFDWSEIDRLVKAAEDHGMDTFFTNDFIPEWATADKRSCRPDRRDPSLLKCTSMVADIRDWDDFVTALATRYKRRMHIYELWNEPWNELFFTGRIEDMVTLTTHMDKIIRAIDPEAVIVGPAPTPHQYLARYLAAGGVRTADVYAVHGYPTRMHATAETSQAWLSQPFKNILAQNGLSSKPIWDTEGGWATAKNLDDPDEQAAFVARSYLIHWAAGFSRYYWYAWDEPQWGTLWRRDSGPNKSAKAYEQVYHWMVGATMTRPCAEKGGDTWTCGFTRPGGYAAEAVWNTSGSKSYSVGSQYTQYRDLDGRTVMVNSGSVEIGPKPILLENSSPQ